MYLATQVSVFELPILLRACAAKSKSMHLLKKQGLLNSMAIHFQESVQIIAALNMIVYSMHN